MTDARRAELLVAYERHARRFALAAESRSRRAAAASTGGGEVQSLRGVTSGLHPSDRQIEVLRLIADGFSNRSIARELRISEETVKSHVKQLAERFGSKSRAHTVSLGYRYGLLTAEPLLAFPGDEPAPLNPAA